MVIIVDGKQDQGSRPQISLQRIAHEPVRLSTAYIVPSIEPKKQLLFVSAGDDQTSPPVSNCHSTLGLPTSMPGAMPERLANRRNCCQTTCDSAVGTVVVVVAGAVVVVVVVVVLRAGDAVCGIVVVLAVDVVDVFVVLCIAAVDAVVLLCIVVVIVDVLRDAEAVLVV